MATFDPIDALDYHERRELCPNDQRGVNYHVHQLNTHSAIARHPNTPDIAHRLLTSRDFEIDVADNSLRLRRSLGDGLYEAAISTSEYITCCANGLTAAQVAELLDRQQPLPQGIPRLVLQQLGLPYPPMFTEQSLDPAGLTVSGTRRLLTETFYAIQETILASLAWIAEADRVAAELEQLGLPCGWVYERLVDERYRGPLEQMAPVFDHTRLNRLLIALVRPIVPQPLHHRTTMALVADQVHRDMLAAPGIGAIAIYPQVHDNLLIGYLPSPFSVPILYMPCSSSEAIHNLHRRLFPYEPLPEIAAPEIIVVSSDSEEEAIIDE